MRINFKYILLTTLLALGITSCTFSGGSHEKSNGVTKFITGSTTVEGAQNVHVINMIHAIGAPNNSIVIDKYKYYLWQNSRSVGVSTLFGGGSTTLYCNLTVETQNNKIKLINWYGNQCGVFLEPIGDYFKDKLNIAVIMEDDEKKVVAPVKSSVGNDGDKDSATPATAAKPVLDLRNSEQKIPTSEQKEVELPKTSAAAGVDIAKQKDGAVATIDSPK